MTTDALLSSDFAQRTRETSKYHFLSTIIIGVWTLFILGTVLIHELAHRHTWDPARILAGNDVSWIYQSGLGLPRILATVICKAGHSLTGTLESMRVPEHSETLPPIWRLGT